MFKIILRYFRVLTYTFPIGLEPNGITFGAKSIGKAKTIGTV